MASTTLGPAGTGATYSSMALLITGEAQVLTEPYYVYLRGGGDASTDGAGAEWTGWGTTDTNRVIIEPETPADGANGLSREEGGTGYSYARSSSSGFSITVQSDVYLTLRNFEVTYVVTSTACLVTGSGCMGLECYDMIFNSYAACVDLTSTGGDWIFQNCRFTNGLTGSNNNSRLDTRQATSPVTLNGCDFFCVVDYSLLANSNTSLTNSVFANSTTASILASGLPGSGSNNAYDDGTSFGANSVSNIDTSTAFDDFAGGGLGYRPAANGDLDKAGIDVAGDTTDITGEPHSSPRSIGAYTILGGPPPVGIQEMYIKDGGIFVKYTPHVKVGGTFQEVDAYVLEAGSWVPVHEK